MRPVKVDLGGMSRMRLRQASQDRQRGTDRPYTASSANNQPVVTIHNNRIKRDHDHEV